MLRLTGEVLDSIVGYAPTNIVAEAVVHESDDMPEEKLENRNHESENNDGSSVLKFLLAFLDDLDKAWLAVLRNQVWNSEESVGKDGDELEPGPSPSTISMEVDQDLIANTSMDVDSNSNQKNPGPCGVQSKSASDSQLSLPPSISQTDRTRLRSLLITGTQKLEDWLPPIMYTSDDMDFDVVASKDQAPTQAQASTRDLEEMMDAINVRDLFNDIFWRTLTEMGEFS
jgi:hypothetical protein